MWPKSQPVVVIKVVLIKRKVYISVVFQSGPLAKWCICYMYFLPAYLPSSLSVCLSVCVYFSSLYFTLSVYVRFAICVFLLIS